MPPVSRHPVGPDDPGLPFAAGSAEPSTQTLSAAGDQALKPWPWSVLGRLRYGRRLRSGEVSPGEERHVERLTTVAAARDVGSTADAVADDDGVVRVDPPNRGTGRRRLLAELERRMPELARAITTASNATEQVNIRAREVETRRDDLNHAREAMPPRPRVSDVPWAPLLAFAIGFAAIEGIVTRPLWIEVTQDVRYGTPFAVAFAFVFAFAAHELAKWLWSLAESFGRLREATLAVVGLMVVCAAGLIVVAGVERDELLVANRAAKQAAVAQREAAKAAAAASIAAGVAAAPPPAVTEGAQSAAGTGSQPSPVGPASAPSASTAVPPSAAAGGGLLGALGGGSATPAAPAAPAATAQAAPRTTPATPPVDARSVAAVPAIASPPPASGGTAGVEGVSFKFVVWVNFLVLLALVLLARGRSLNDAHRRAAKRLRAAEERDTAARAALRAAEARRQDASLPLDYAERVLIPLAERFADEERHLDRLFVDQVQRTALANGHSAVPVKLRTEPEDLREEVTRLLETELPTLSPMPIRLPALATDVEPGPAIAGMPDASVDADGPSPFASSPTGQPPAGSDPTVGEPDGGPHRGLAGRWWRPSTWRGRRSDGDGDRPLSGVDGDPTHIDPYDAPTVVAPTPRPRPPSAPASPAPHEARDVDEAPLAPIPAPAVLRDADEAPSPSVVAAPPGPAFVRDAEHATAEPIRAEVVDGDELDPDEFEALAPAPPAGAATTVSTSVPWPRDEE